MPRVTIETKKELKVADFCTHCWPPSSEMVVAVADFSCVPEGIIWGCLRKYPRGSGHPPYDSRFACFSCGQTLDQLEDC